MLPQLITGINKLTTKFEDYDKWREKLDARVDEIEIIQQKHDNRLDSVEIDSLTLKEQNKQLSFDLQRIQQELKKDCWMNLSKIAFITLLILIIIKILVEIV